MGQETEAGRIEYIREFRIAGLNPEDVTAVQIDGEHDQPRQTRRAGPG